MVNSIAEEPLNKGHIGDNTNSLVLSFLETREVVIFSEVLNSKYYLGPQAVSLVERSIIQCHVHCRYLRGSTIGGFTTMYCNPYR